MLLEAPRSFFKWWVPKVLLVAVPIPRKSICTTIRELAAEYHTVEESWVPIPQWV